MERFRPETSSLVVGEDQVAVRYFRGDPRKPTLVSLSGWGSTRDTVQAHVDGLHAADPSLTILTYEVTNPGRLPETSAIHHNGEILHQVVQTNIPDGKFLAVAHGIGTANLLAGVKAHPELLERLDTAILVDPIGLFHSDSLHRPYKGSHLPVDWTETIGGANHNSAKRQRLEEEARDLPLLAMYNALRLLTDAGVKTAVVVFTSDDISSTDRLVRQLVNDTSIRPILLHKEAGGARVLTPEEYGTLLTTLLSDLKTGPSPVTAASGLSERIR